MSNEFILCSAIYFDDGTEHLYQPKNIDIGYVVCGRRHHNCYGTSVALCGLDDVKNNKLPEIQGFLTSYDRFVDREEALFIARREGQMIYESDYSEKKILFSEDLW